MLHAKDITVTYDAAATTGPVLDKVSCSLAQGEFLAVAGRSGSGKTTLLHVLSTLLQPDSGSLHYKGRDVLAMDEAGQNRLRRSDFAVIFQFHHLMPYMTALENTLLPFMQGVRGVSRELRQRAEHSLERVGLAHRLHRLPGQLSGGEQQRVAIARALVKDAAILFADEPTGSLDRSTGEAILDLLQDLNAEGLGIVMVTHEEDYARRAHRIMRMEGGVVSAACSGEAAA